MDSNVFDIIRKENKRKKKQEIVNPDLQKNDVDINDFLKFSGLNDELNFVCDS